jgi:arylsulfatase A-like enzyme
MEKQRMAMNSIPSRRGMLAAAAALGAAPLLALRNSASAAPSPRPNIVIILADDQGWGDLSIHGNTNLSTPNIDSIGSRGAVFDRFFACAVCAPTRAEFLTGRYHPRSGVRGVTAGAERMNLDETTIADTFRAAGYATGAFGKWHNGSQHPYHPNARGFDEFYGFTHGHWAQYFDPELDHNGKLVRGKGYIVDDLTEKALGFIESNKTRPFFAYLPFNTPHSPMQVPDRFFEKFAHRQIKMRNRNPDQEEIPMTRAALAMCENIDWNVGRVLSKLDQLGVSENTIVAYFSDNGPNSWRWNAGMKGRKGSVDEGGLRVPFLIRWPAAIKPRTRIPQIAGAIDLLPTLAEMAGVPLTSSKPLDGKSLKPLLTGDNANWPDRNIFSLQGNRVSVRTQRHRLDSDGSLFDMVTDPGQDRDIAAENPDLAATLKASADAWTKDMLASLGPDERPLPVGYWHTTFLPARDGKGLGGITRSSKHPNDSFFMSWASKNDSMTWDIEVSNTGEYEAFVYYTCPKQDVGSVVELEFLGATVKGKIAEAHDPPLLGASQDRVIRSESYMKDFKPLRLGKIRLQKGRGLLSLRALEIPGNQVADLRYIVLTRA